ncbi:MAG: 1-acyl-sn-glycerol-3-phosphate acyltransferase [Planctomycetota bacterium]|jgi:1-acyl-sn-glycerol-3-phosphate acyltransferase
MSRFWWRLLRAFAWLCVSAYYSAFRVEWGERIPKSGPVLFVVNHPNALVDGGAVLRAVPRPVSFAAKDTLFQIPVLGWILRKLGTLPVHRPKDHKGKGRENLKMFAAFTQLFREGGAAVIFPEGMTHLDPELKEVKSGPARLALDSEADAEFELGLRILPIGLHFEPEQQFRGEVFVRVGEPFTVTDLKDTHRREAIRIVQQRIADGLRPMMLHLEHVELEPLVRGIAEVYDEYQHAHPDGLAPRPRAEVVLVAGDCLNYFMAADPGAVDVARRKYEWYRRLAKRTGVTGEALESHARPFKTWVSFLGLALTVLFGFPVFLFGLLVAFAPYRVTDRAAARSARTAGPESVPVLRMAWGAIIFGAFWGALSAVAYWWSQSIWFALFFFAAMVASGFFARYYWVRVRGWKARMGGMRPLVKPGINRVARARDDLIEYVGGLVGLYSEATGAALLPPRRIPWYRRVPWRAAASVLLIAALAWFAWGFKDRDVSELAGRASPWSSLDADRARTTLESDAAAVVGVLDTLDRLDGEMRALRADFDSGRRGFIDEEDARAIRQALLTYVNCRATLFRMAWFYRRPDRAGEPVTSDRAFLLSYASAIELARRGMQLIEFFDGEKNAIRKLNEGDPAWGIPPDTYDRVRSNLANTEVLDELAAATAEFSTLPDPGGGPHWARLARQAEQGAEVVARLSKKRSEYKWDAAVARAKRKIGKTRYELSKFFAVAIGKVRMRSGDLANGLIDQAQVDWLREEVLQPGDILLERRNWALSNVFLPGFWTHAALYIGGLQGLRELGIEEDEAVTPHLKALARDDGKGNPRVVLEALGPGVVLNTLEYSVGEADAVCVLRPRMDKPRIAQAMALAMRQYGKPYDFDFDFFSSDRLVCTELVYRAYDEFLKFELQEIMGRKTLPAIQILQTWANERGRDDAQLELVAFLDSIENEGVAREGDEDRLLETLERPGLTVLQEHGGSATIPRYVLLTLTTLLLVGLLFLRKRR